MKILKKNFWLVILLLIGIFVRLVFLDRIPRGLNTDASWDGLAAIDILRGNISSYIPYAFSWHGEGLLRLLIAVLFYLFGVSSIAIKTASAIFSVMLLPVFYLVSKKITDKKTALWSLLFLSVSGWQFVMGRSGWRAVTLPFFSTLTVLFLIKSITDKSYWMAILFGICNGMLIYTYDSAKHLPVFFTAWFILLVVLKNKDEKIIKIKKIILAVLLTLVMCIPMMVYIRSHPDEYFSRAKSLYAENFKNKNVFSILEKNLKSTLGLYTVRGNGNDFFISKPLLDAPVIPLFMTGLIALLFSIGNWKLLFLFSWLIAGLIPGLLSVPNGNRAIDTATPVYLITGMGMVFAVSFLGKIFNNRQKQIINILAACYGIFVILNFYQTYLGPKRAAIVGFAPHMLAITTVLNSLPKEKYAIYVADSFPWELFNFYLYSGGDPFLRHYVYLYSDKDKLLTAQRLDKPLAFVLMNNSENEAIINNLLKKYPGSKTINLFNEDYSPVIILSD